MDQRSYSWVGGGSTFPKVRGKPKWVDARTCVLAVTLQENHKYWLGVNSASHTSFRSVKGQPATVYQIAFQTGKRKDLTADPAAWRRAVDQSIKQLRLAIERDYSYRHRLGVSWDKLFSTYRRRLKSADTPRAFGEAVAQLLANTKDLHVWVKLGDENIPVYKSQAKANYDMQVLAGAVPQWRRLSECVYSGRFPDGIGYIMITSWEKDKLLALEKAFEALDDSLGAKGLIVDVRPNGGGTETFAQFFAGCFVDKPVLYAQHVYRDSSRPGGFSAPHKRVLTPKKGRPRYRGKVVVLMGQRCMSSCEAFLLMMKQVPNCTLIGARSRGSSGNPKPLYLPVGVTVYLPSWKAMDADGRAIEGRGIAPDVEVRPASGSAKSDPVLKAALERLRR